MIKELILENFKKRRNGLYNIHYKVKDICVICGKMADDKGITKLELSNKNHSYNTPINPTDWQYVHHSCHFKYDMINNNSEKFGRPKDYIKIHIKDQQVKNKIKKLYIHNKLGLTSISKFLKGEDPPIVISPGTVRNILIEMRVKLRDIYHRSKKE